MIVEYSEKYDEEIKNLLLELQMTISNLDKEGYNIVTDEYKELYFKETMKTIKEKSGKMLLYKQNEKIIGLIVGIVYNEKTDRYDFKCPKRGRITELIVSKEYRKKGIGRILLNEMKSYLKSIGCEKIMIAVFGYNEKAIEFYNKNGYHLRMIDMIED